MTKCKGCVRENDNEQSSCDMCFESIENMAQIIDIAKIGWTKKQIVNWLQSKAE